MPQWQAVSVVIPVYNGQDSLCELLESVESVMGALADQFEVIFVEDGGRDESWNVIIHLAEKFPFVVGLKLMRNYGQHNALLCGIRAARYPIVVTIDDDGQHRPEEIPKLLERLADGFDVVYGSPVAERHGLLRNAASKLTKLALRSTMGAQTARKVSAFRAFKTELRRAFEQFSGPYVCIDVLLTWATTRFDAVEVQHCARRHGRSNYTFWILVRHALNMLTGFSTFPLRVASFVGFTFTVLGAALLAFILLRYLIQGAPVQGFAFLASSIAVLSGAQLFALGIMGEYLARMYSRMMDRPSYAVAERVNQTQTSEGTSSIGRVAAV
jgi:undecaprenyl-phosphate 4-deoxy-4-formamido-L-arabinose transferase